MGGAKNREGEGEGTLESERGRTYSRTQQRGMRKIIRGLGQKVKGEKGRGFD